LRRSLREGKIFDQPPQTVQRYIVDKKHASCFAWRLNNKCRSIPKGKVLRVILYSSALVHWSFDGWQTSMDTDTSNTGLGTHVADLPSDKLASGRQVVFTVYWKEEQRWEGIDFTVTVED